MSSIMRSAASASIVLLSVGLLAACGKKGPLYLPDRGSEVVTRPVATPPAEPAPDSAETEEQRKKREGATPPPPQQ